MIKKLKGLGDTWYEVLGNILVLVLLAPGIIGILIIAAPFIAINVFWSWLRKEPKPLIPKIPIKEDWGTERIAQEYTSKLDNLVKHIEIKRDPETKNCILTTPALSPREVHINTSDFGVEITIDDLNCYEWISSEAPDMDCFFWIAKAVLQYGVYPSRTKLGRLVYWTKSDELKVWVKVQKEGSTYDGIEFYNQPPDKIASDFEKTIKS